MPPSRPTVRLVYLVPSDRQPREDYATAIGNAAAHVQRWYWEQLDRRFTFPLHAPRPEVVRLEKSERWFATNARPSKPTEWFWENLLGEAFAATGARFGDPLHRWVFYADAEHDPGQSVGAADGVAVLPEHDLVGLLGGAMPGHLRSVPRWVGGLGHELGHALGLPHPPACEKDRARPECQCLMYLGYVRYPDTWLLDEEKGQLLASPFIVEASPLRKRFACDDLLRAGGRRAATG